MVNAGSVVVDFKGDDSKLAGAFARTDRGFNKMVKSAAALTVTYIGLRKSVQMFSDSVSLFAKFEQSVTNAGAVTGKFGAELKAATDNVAKISRMLGKETVFKATQAADAFYNLASAGVDVANVTKNEMRPVLDLAAATQSDLAFTTETTINTLKQFELGMESSGRVADVFVGAIGNSMAKLDRLQVSLSQAGASAAGYNVDLETTVAALTKFYDRGIGASQAGNVFKSMMAKLSSSTNNVKNVLEKYNLTLTDTDVKTRGLVPVLNTLKTAQMSMADLQILFGERYGAFAKVIVDSADSIGELSEKLRESGGLAERVAKEQLSTLQGSFKLLSSAMEEVTLQMGEALAPTMRKLAEGTTENAQLVTDMGEAVTEVLVPALELLVGILPVIIGGLASAANVMTTIIEAMRTIQAKAKLRDDYEIIDYSADAGLTPKQIADIKAKNQQLLDDVEGGGKKTMEQGLELQVSVAVMGGNSEAIKEAKKELADYREFVLGETGDISDKIRGNYEDKIQGDFDKMAASLGGVKKSAKDAKKEVDKLHKYETEAMRDKNTAALKMLEIKERSEELTNKEVRTMERLGKATGIAFDISQAEDFEEILDALDEHADDLADALDDVIDNIEKAEDAFIKMGEAAGRRIDKLIDKMADLKVDMAEDTTDAAEKMVAAFKDAEESKKQLESQRNREGGYLTAGEGDELIEAQKIIDDFNKILDQQKGGDVEQSLVDSLRAALDAENKLKDESAIGRIQADWEASQAKLKLKEDEINILRQMDELFLEDLKAREEGELENFEEGNLAAFVEQNQMILTEQQIRHAEELISEANKTQKFLKLNEELQQDITTAMTDNIAVRDKALEEFKNSEVSRLGEIKKAALEAIAVINAAQKAAASVGSGGFATGGYTGRGSSQAVAGLVHKNEYVVPTNVLKDPSGGAMVNILERMRKGFATSFAGGGFTGGETNITNNVSVQDEFDVQSFLEDMAFTVRST